MCFFSVGQVLESGMQGHVADAHAQTHGDNEKLRLVSCRGQRRWHPRMFLQAVQSIDAFDCVIVFPMP